MSIDFSKWDKAVDLAGLQADIEDAKKNGGTGDYKKVPRGEYEVKVEKIELKESKKGDPMAFVQFRILNGEYKNSCIFMNQVITQGFQIHLVNQFLRSLDTDLDIDFKSYTQYSELLLDVAEACDESKLEFALKYEDNKGYDKYTITEVFEG